MRLAFEPRNLRLTKLAARSKKCEKRLCYLDLWPFDTKS